MPGSQTSPQSVSNALGRVLASPEFARSERARDLLRYLVETEQAGRGGELKGYSIAIDVFGKGEGFDPANDPVVRVQAGRLRELLRAYYDGSGRADPLRIVVPRGGYAPRYEAASSGMVRVAAAHPVVLVERSGVEQIPMLLRRLRLVSAALVLFAAVLGYVVYTGNVVATRGGQLAALDAFSLDAGTTGATLPGRLLPAIGVETGGNAGTVEAVDSLLRRGIAGFDTVELISANAPQTRSGAAPDFVIAVSDDPASSGALLELRDTASRRVVFSGVISPSPAERLQDAVAQFLTTTMTDRGVLYAHIVESGRVWPLTQCLLLNRAYYFDQTSRNHRKAYDCLEALARAGARSSVVYSELASLHLEAITDGHPYPKNSDRRTALDLARRAVSLGPMSPFAYRATGFLLTQTGSTEEANRWMKKAYDLNRFDLSMAASYGYALMKSGRYAESTKVMQRAVSLAGARPTWWDYTLFLGEFMQGQMDSAAIATGPLATTRRSHYLAAQLIAARHSGHTRRATELLAEIVKDYPKFATDPRRHFDDARYPADLTDRLVEALQAAGLGRRG